LRTATNAGRPGAGASSRAVLMRPATAPACANSASAAEAVADENVMATPVGTRANPGRTDPQWGESGLSLPRAASPPAATTHPTAASADRLALATRRAVAEPATDQSSIGRLGQPNGSEVCTGFFSGGFGSRR